MAVFNESLSKAERLAASLARGTLKPHWVVKVINHYFAVPKPNLTNASIAEVKQFLFRLGSCFESEFDTTGSKVK